MTRGGRGTAGGACPWPLGFGRVGIVVDQLKHDRGALGVGEGLVTEGSVDEGDDGVATRVGAAGSAWGEEDGLVEGNVANDHSFPVEPPVGSFPTGNDEEGTSLVLMDFLEDAVEKRPGWVDVGADLVPAVGNRVASEGGGVAGLR